ncbi:MAG: hypothetical protein IT317_00060 [Anaerolineales bacterium]|nr:hypothetical protein [Anaerolineales bacterium]
MQINMLSPKVALKVVSYTLVSALVFVSTLAYAEIIPGLQAQAASPAAPLPLSADAETLPPPPALLTDRQARVNSASLSSTLSYYFISGNTFTPYSGTSTPYFRQATGCVSQMPIGHPFSAPVHLPQASQVVSITLYTYDSVLTSTVSTAYFLINDGQGNGGYTVSASGLPNTTGYQQTTSAQNNPAGIDNQAASYAIHWVTQGTSPSPALSLCGVRVAYYAPLGAMYLPFIANE